MIQEIAKVGQSHAGADDPVAWKIPKYTYHIGV